MSAPDATSIPTSSDPRSRRPLKKKRALSPASAQASQLSHLFAHPDVEIRLPSSAPSGPRIPPPPEIVTNVQGSSAGAGSGEFHVYKAARRREYERLRAMDEEVARERAAEEFETVRREREARDEEKTRRNREKREKKKQKQKQQQRGKQKETGGGNGKGGEDTPVTASGGKDKTPAAEGDGVANGGADDAAGEKTASGGLTTVLPTKTDGPGLVIHDDD